MRVGWMLKCLLVRSRAGGRGRPRHSEVRDWLRAARADVLFEATSLNVSDGQPAIDHIRAALESRRTRHHGE